MVVGADAAGCNGRYGWDMLSGHSVPIEGYVDIYDLSDPRTWDEDDNTPGTHGCNARPGG